MTPALYSWAKIESWWGRDCYIRLVPYCIFVFSPVTLRRYDSHLHVSYVGLCNVCFFQRHCDGTTLRQSLGLSMHIMSVFSAATLRQYDTTTVPCPKYLYACLCFLQPATLRQYDTTTVPCPKYWYACLCLLQPAILRHYDSTLSYVCLL